jgi:hypothetical protein
MHGCVQRSVRFRKLVTRQIRHARTVVWARRAVRQHAQVVFDPVGSSSKGRVVEDTLAASSVYAQQRQAGPRAGEVTQNSQGVPEATPPPVGRQYLLTQPAGPLS